MQEDLEQRTVSVSIQTAKLSGRVLRSAIAAVLRKMEQERTTPKVGRNSMKRLTYKTQGPIPLKCPAESALLSGTPGNTRSATI